ncbi:MAG: sodium transporter, partial [Pseudomonadota bacterium]
FISAPAFVGIRDGGGLIWLSYEFAIPLAMLLLLWLVLPSLHASGVVSIYDFLEQRFNRFTRILISVVFQISRSFATAIMIYAISIVLQSTMGLPFWLSILSIGVITLIYSAVGGMKAVVIGDAIQMGLIVIGAALCLWFALNSLGGWHVIVENTPSERLSTIKWAGIGLDGNDFGFLPMLFGGLVLYMSYYGCDQSEAQRSLASKDIKDLRKILVTVGLARFPITLLYCFSGLAIGALFHIQPDFAAQIPEGKNDWLVPIFIVNYLPNGIIGILVVAMMAAAMSSLSSAINSLSAVTVEDIARLTNSVKNGTEARSENAENYVNRARLAGVLWGLVTLTLASYAGDIAPTVIEAVNKIGSVFYGPILAIFLLGILTKRIGASAASIGLIVGVGTNISLWLTNSPIFWFWWNVIGLASTLLSAFLVHSVSKKETKTHDNYFLNGVDAVSCITLLLWFAFVVFVVVFLPTMLF